MDLKGGTWGLPQLSRETRLELLRNAFQIYVKRQLFIYHILQDLWGKRKLGDGPKIRQNKWGQDSVFLMGRLDRSLFKSSWDTARHLRGIIEIHNTGPSGRENFLKEEERNAVKDCSKKAANSELYRFNLRYLLKALKDDWANWRDSRIWCGGWRWRPDSRDLVYEKKLRNSSYNLGESSAPVWSQGFMREFKRNWGLWLLLDTRWD